MKKLLVLSALLGLLALPAFSVDASFGGDLTFGFITDFDAEDEDTAATIDLTGSVDDYNSVAISWAANGALLDKSTVTTDVGAWLGLGDIGVSLQWGYDDPDLNGFGDVSNWETEAIPAFSPNEYWGLDLLVSYGMFELELAGNPGAKGVGPGQFLAGVAVKEPIPGLNAEVYMYQGNDNVAPAPFVDDFDMMKVCFDAGYAGAFGDLDMEAGAYFLFDMDDAATDAWAYGIGLTGAYSIAYAEVALNGNETDALGTMTAEVAAGPFADLATLFAAFEMNFADAAAETFQGAEFGLEFETGATWWAVGYQINNDAFAGFNAPTTLPDGGLFFNWDINY
jgi:hypothetical protein